MRLDQNVNHVAVLIHGPPQISLLAVDSNEGFIQMPVVAQPSLSSLQSPSIDETELLTPLPNRFIGYDDAALGEKIFDIPETQAEAMISPHRIADDLGREPIAGVTKAITLHGTSVSGFVRKLTMPFCGRIHVHRSFPTKTALAVSFFVLVEDDFIRHRRNARDNRIAYSHSVRWHWILAVI
jgi:hypothetical protein